jgi:Zn-dependent protease with chaperone function
MQHLLWPNAGPPWPLAALAAWLGAVAGTWPLDHQIFPSLDWRAWAHQVLAAWTLRFAFWFLFIGIAVTMPEELDVAAFVLAAVYFAVIGFWMRGGLVWACRKARLLTLPPERLRVIVAGVSARMQVPVSGIWLLKSPGASAYALPYTRELFFSDRLLATHPDEEIAAICAHELGHLSESKWVRAVRLVGLLYMVPWLFARPIALIWGAGGIFSGAMVSWVTYLSVNRLARRLERRADQIGQENEAESGAYARALARLHEENLVPAVLPGKHTHPDLYDRLLAVGVQPDYPRPEKPEKTTWPFQILLLLLILLGIITLVKWSAARSESRSGTIEARIERSLAV